MATGRRDYTYGYLNELRSGSRAVTRVFTNDYSEIIAGDYDTVYEYTVPAGYRFSLFNVMVMSAEVEKYVVVIYLDDIVKYYAFHDSANNIEFPPTSPLMFLAGEKVTVNVENMGLEDTYYYTTIIGILEHINP